MKHIKLFEKYSLPNSVEKLTSEITEFIAQIFEKWWMSGDTSNYNNYHTMVVSGLDPDFPVKKVKLRLKFKNEDTYVDKKRRNLLNRSGLSYGYTGKSRMRPIIYKDNTTSVGMELMIYVPTTKKSYHKEELIQNIEDMISHELLHSYQSYKLKSKGIEDPIYSGSYNTPWAIMDIYEHVYKYKFLARFIYVAYISSILDETTAHLAEAHFNDDWVKRFLLVYKMSFDEVVSAINKEVDGDKKAKKYIEDKFTDSDDKRIQSKTFEGIIKSLYNIIQHRKEYIYRKLVKIKYSKGEYKKSNEGIVSWVKKAFEDSEDDVIAKTLLKRIPEIDPDDITISELRGIPYDDGDCKITFLVQLNKSSQLVAKYKKENQFSMEGSYDTEEEEIEIDGDELKCSGGLKVKMIKLLYKIYKEEQERQRIQRISTNIG